MAYHQLQGPARGQKFWLLLKVWWVLDHWAAFTCRWKQRQDDRDISLECLRSVAVSSRKREWSRGCTCSKKSSLWKTKPFKTPNHLQYVNITAYALWTKHSTGEVGEEEDRAARGAYAYSANCLFSRSPSPYNHCLLPSLSISPTRGLRGEGVNHWEEEMKFRCLWFKVLSVLLKWLTDNQDTLFSSKGCHSHPCVFLAMPAFHSCRSN